MSYPSHVSRPYKQRQAREAQKQAYVLGVSLFEDIPPVSVGEQLKQGFRTGYGPEAFAEGGNWLGDLAYAVGQYAKDLFSRSIGQGINNAEQAASFRKIEHTVEGGDRFAIYENGIPINKYSIDDLQTRCDGICKQKHPGTHPVLGIFNNCYCKKTPISRRNLTFSQLQTRCVGICKSRYPGRRPWVNSEGSCFCKTAASGTVGSAGGTGTSTGADRLTSGCSYSGCNSFTGMSRCSCRCAKICASKGGVKNLTSTGGCYCKGASSTTSKPVNSLTSGCSYSGCNSFTGMSRCSCRCSKLCANKGGVKTVTSNGACYCKGTISKPVSNTTSKPVDRLTSGCSYSGCNGFTGMSRCNCRCAKLCASKGGVKTVTSNGSCYCKGVQSSSGSGGCSDALKTRCGFFCASRPGNPVLDSKCSCFCR